MESELNENWYTCLPIIRITNDAFFPSPVIVSSPWATMEATRHQPMRTDTKPS